MKISHDPRHNIAYIRLQEKTVEVLTLKISDELNVDVGPDGSVHGIELLNANKQLYKEDEGTPGRDGRPGGTLSTWLTC